MPSRLDNLSLALDLLLQLLSTIALVLFLIRISSRNLARLHWPLTAFAVLECVNAVARFLIPITAVATVYRVVEIAKLAAAILLIWRLSGSLFSAYPAIGSFAARASKFTVAACLLLGWISFLTDPVLPAGRSPQLHLFISIERAVTSGLLTFLVLLSVFVGWFPVRMGRNLGRILIGFLMILAASWVSDLTSNSNSQNTSWGNILYSLVLLGASVYWAITIVPAGEKETATTVSAWDPERMDQLTSRLAQMEAQLARRGY